MEQKSAWVGTGLFLIGGALQLSDWHNKYVASTLAILGLFCFVPLIKEYAGRWTIVKKSDRPETQLARGAFAFAWLPSLIEHDEQNMENLVKVRTIPCSTPHLDAPEPYIDVEVEVINCSIFSITPQSVDQRLRIHNEPLSKELELLNRTSIGHGRDAVIRLRQWLAQSAVTIERAHSTNLEVGYVGLLFAYTDSKDRQKTVHIALGNTPFIVTI